MVNNEKKIENLKTLVIVPAYNESETIIKVVDEISHNVPFVDIVVIDDGSSDDTYLQAKETGVFVLRHPFNLGIGSAVQSGFKFAFEHNYDVAIQVDGDGQHDPKYIPKMLELIQDNVADVIGGSRFLTKEGFQSSLFRRLGIKYFEILFKILTGKKVTDCTAGFRAFSKDTIKLISKVYPDDFPEPEAVIHIYKAGFTFTEVPVVMRERLGGQSSISGIKPLIYMIKVTLALLMNVLRGDRIE